MATRTKSEPLAVTASDVNDPVAKGATPEQVQAATAEAHEVQHGALVKAAEDAASRAKQEGESERTYVVDDDGIPRLAAAKGQKLPEWAEKMAEKSGGKSNTPPKDGPEATA